MPVLPQMVVLHTGKWKILKISGALQGKAKLKWDEKNLDKWITKPAGFAPGNKMGFAGVDSKQDRMDIIAFLKANS